MRKKRSGEYKVVYFFYILKRFSSIVILRAVFTILQCLLSKQQKNNNFKSQICFLTVREKEKNGSMESNNMWGRDRIGLNVCATLVVNIEMSLYSFWMVCICVYVSIDPGSGSHIRMS